MCYASLGCEERGAVCFGAVGWLVGWLLCVEWFVCMLLRGKKKKKEIKKREKERKEKLVFLETCAVQMY